MESDLIRFDKCIDGSSDYPDWSLIVVWLDSVKSVLGIDKLRIQMAVQSQVIIFAQVEIINFSIIDHNLNHVDSADC